VVRISTNPRSRFYCCPDRCWFGELDRHAVHSIAIDDDTSRVLLETGVYGSSPCADGVSKKVSALAAGVVPPRDPGMNEAFPEMPTLRGEYHVHRTPEWLVALFRASFGIAAIGLAAMSLRDWGEMPLGFRGLVCILVPAFVFFALRTPRAIKFLADDRGVFFPCNALLVSAMGRERSNRWLLVPWNNISNVRVATEIDHEGSSAKCVAFDVKVSPDEQAEFFQHVGYPSDRTRNRGDCLPVAYRDFPPVPKTTVALLEPVHDLLSKSTRKARWMNCRLVLSLRSQFFHKRRHFSIHANDRSTTQRWGITAKVCSSLRLAI
jgi:hypothetical protein